MGKRKRKKKSSSKKMIKYLTLLLCIVIILLVAVLLLIKIGQRKFNETENEDIKKTEQTLTSVEEQILTEEAYKIETMYCDLYYPEKWSQQLVIEYLDDEPYIVRFFGQLPNKEKQHLFDIEFGENVTEKLGVLEVGKESVDVGYVFGEPQVESWTIDEADIIYAMQEDINYLIGMLEQENEYIAEIIN